MALELDIKAVAESRCEAIERGVGRLRLAFGDQPIDRTRGPTGKENETVGMSGKPLRRRMRKIARLDVEVGSRKQLREIDVAELALHQKRDGWIGTPRLQMVWRRTRCGRLQIYRERHAHDRLHARFRERIR